MKTSSQSLPVSIIRFLAVFIPCFLSGGAQATPQFIPPGGLPPSTPVGTQGATLGTLEDDIARNARNIEALTTAGVTHEALGNALAGYLSAAQADDRYALQSALGSYVLRSGGTIDGAPGKGLSLTNPDPEMGSDGVTHLDFSSPMANELTITANAPGSNVLAVNNTAPTGFSALTFRGHDANLSASTGQEVNFEHAAIGYGGSLPFQMGKGHAFLEVSRYDGTANPLLAPAPWILMHTGAEFVTFAERYIDTTAGSTTVSCHGCAFPSGIDGMVIDAPAEYGLFAQPTTIRSGAGTSTLTLTAAAQGSRSNIVARFGPTAYHQYDNVVWSEMGNMDWFTYPSARDGNFNNWPFFSTDFNYGRIGIWNNHPEAELDVVGNAIFGANRNARGTFGNLGIINSICQPGSGNRNQVDRNTLLDGIDTLQGVCLNNPGRYAWSDLNIANRGDDAVLYELYLDGSRATRIVAHPVRATTASRQLMLTDCGTTITAASDSPITMNVGPGLISGCRITITQLGTGTVTVIPQNGETLGSWNNQSQTGSYTLPGQYASAVLEAKTDRLATIERGQ